MAVSRQLAPLDLAAAAVRGLGFAAIIAGDIAIEWGGGTTADAGLTPRTTVAGIAIRVIDRRHATADGSLAELRPPTAMSERTTMAPTVDAIVVCVYTIMSDRTSSFSFHTCTNEQTRPVINQYA